ncbi:acyl carrier protein [Micromonospora sp. NBC_01796]|uniref:acyl carrier protein n=1 Tax=Micromonospora sp. NBC_01796 TaxID=2975987 RepID=UPI002DD9A01A|nr:acyl carrier protein [Micromonospora sp. NBC_01796]WSA85944.1 acyl carrier protein [Micromonospora sp. NBC_01796]
MSASAVDTERFEEIKEIVCETLELEPEEVTESSLFQEEHGSDSLGAIEVLSALERRYHVVIDQAEMARMTNLRGVYDVVAKAANW